MTTPDWIIVGMCFLVPLAMLVRLGWKIHTAKKQCQDFLRKYESFVEDEL